MRRSVYWVIADTGGTTVISMLAMLVMARLIGPSDFGSAALAIGLIQVINLYVEGLLHDALIQSRTIAEEAFDQGFWLVTALGTALAAIAGIAWLLLRGMDGGAIAMLIFAAALSLPFSGITGSCNARLRREMDYKIVAAPSVAAKLFSSLIGLAAAFAGAGAWSLIIQFVAGAVIQATGLLLASNWRPPLQFSIKALAPIWGFALPYAVMHTLVGLRIQGFTALAAAFGGLASAGYINVAFRLTLAPQLILATTLTNLGLPLLSQHQNDRPALLGAYHRLNKLTALTFPVAFLGVAVCADPLVRVLLGTQWLPSIVPIQIFAAGGAVYFLRMPSTLLLRALGQVRYSLLNAIMHIVITLGIMVCLRSDSAVVESLLWVAPLVPLMPLTFYIVQREAGMSVATQLSGAAGPAVCALAMAAAVLAVSRPLAGYSDLATLALSVTTGVLVYTGLILASDGEARALAIRPVRAIGSRLGISLP